MNAPTLTEKAVLVRLSLGQWGATKKEKKIESDAEEKYQTAPDKIKATKVLVAKEALREIVHITTQWRIYHYQVTMPWSDEEKRLLPIELFMDYGKRTREFEELFDGAAKTFFDGYEAMKAQAKIDLNGPYREEDYPELSALRDKFYHTVSFTEIPTGDWRINLSAEEIETLKAATTAEVMTNFQEANKTLWRRLYMEVGCIWERLSGEKEKVFRDSLIKNLVGLVGVLPKLNIAGDKELEAMRKEIEAKLTKYEPQTLRDYKHIRKEVAGEAETILKKMEAYL